jgi:hypothetical protein
MTETTDSLEARLSGLPASCASLAAHVRRYLQRGMRMMPDGTLCIGPAPWIAPQAYAFWLFSPAAPEWLVPFEQRHAVSIPPDYRAVLLALNGCRVYKLALYGLPPSMQQAQPLLDRSRVQPLDLGAANTSWRTEYKGAVAGLHFGGRAWSAEENIGYFWGADGPEAYREHGEVVGRWPDLASLLAVELARAEALFLERAPGDWRV